MPITSDEFDRGEVGPNQVEAFLKEHPNKAYALHEIETALIGPEVNRRLHLDLFIADLVVLAPQFCGERRIECRVIDGTPYFRWKTPESVG
ncbi:MAG: hypothetical protein ABFC89_03960 [Methanospirillum sp.]